jgi:hypothetical protein
MKRISALSVLSLTALISNASAQEKTKKDYVFEASKPFKSEVVAPSPYEETVVVTAPMPRFQATLYKLKENHRSNGGVIFRGTFPGSSIPWISLDKNYSKWSKIKDPKQIDMQVSVRPWAHGSYEVYVTGRATDGSCNLLTEKYLLHPYRDNSVQKPNEEYQNDERIEFQRALVTINHSRQNLEKYQMPPELEAQTRAELAAAEVTARQLAPKFPDGVPFYAHNARRDFDAGTRYILDYGSSADELRVGNLRVEASPGQARALPDGTFMLDLDTKLVYKDADGALGARDLKDRKVKDNLCAWKLDLPKISLPIALPKFQLPAMSEPQAPLPADVRSSSASVNSSKGVIENPSSSSEAARKTASGSGK